MRARGFFGDATVVAAILMAQAEHDPLAACYLVTCDPDFAKKVQERIEVLVAASPRAAITKESLDTQGVVVVASDMDAAIDAVNVIAPEHLELHCENAMGLLGKIENAGAIFVGPWSSEPLGDYVAGPNHTLPTGGTALFSNPLSVEDFVKRSSVVCYTPELPFLGRSGGSDACAGGGSVGPCPFGGPASQAYRRGA